MPIKWTAEKDQVLLLKILETSNISADVKAISESWPAADGEDTPTPRAISERLVKIRAMAKTKGTGNFKVMGVKTSPTKSTPVKRAPRGSGKKPNGKTTTASKRKRGAAKNAISSDDDADNESEASDVSFKSEDNKTDEDDDLPKASPTKKVKAEPVEAEEVGNAMEYEIRPSSMPQEV